MRHVVTAVALAATLLPSLAGAQQKRANCMVGSYAGFDASEAETATSLVCSQLRKRGIATGAPNWEVEGAEETFRVNLRPLGRTVFLGLERIDRSGAIVAEEELALDGIEEVAVAAPRLVDAVVGGTSVEQTASYSNLVGEETRRPRKLGGETFWGLGILGFGVTGTDIYTAPGMLIRTGYETESFGILGDLRFGAGSPADDTAAFFNIGIGGRWFTTSTNWSPFLGVGLSWMSMGVESGRFDGTRSGLASWVEFGIEGLRFYDSRLSIDLRVDVPFFELESDFPKEERYRMPISLAVGYMW